MKSFWNRADIIIGSRSPGIEHSTTVVQALFPLFVGVDLVYLSSRHPPHDVYAGSRMLFGCFGSFLLVSGIVFSL